MGVGFDAGGPGETLSAADPPVRYYPRLECDNNPETGQVTVEAWTRDEPPRSLFLGKVVGFRLDGDDAVIELKRIPARPEGG